MASQNQFVADCPSKQSHSQTEFAHISNHLTSPSLPGGVNEVDDEGGDGEDKHQADKDSPSARLPRDQLPRPVLGLGHEVILLGSALPGLVPLVIRLLLLLSWSVILYFLKSSFLIETYFFFIFNAKYALFLFFPKKIKI